MSIIWNYSYFAFINYCSFNGSWVSQMSDIDVKNRNIPLNLVPLHPTSLYWIMALQHPDVPQKGHILSSRIVGTLYMCRERAPLLQGTSAFIPWWASESPSLSLEEFSLQRVGILTDSRLSQMFLLLCLMLLVHLKLTPCSPYHSTSKLSFICSSISIHCFEVIMVHHTLLYL